MPITFNNICNLLERVDKISTRRPRLSPEREKIRIQKVISDWFCKHREAIDSPTTNGGAVLSALLPHRRKDRVYGLKAASLSKKITNLLNLNDSQKEHLGQWVNGTNGDLGACTEKAIQPWDGTFKNKPTIPIEKLDRLLLQLAARYRYSDPATRKQRDWDFDTDSELKCILVRLASWEAKWLVRLLLKEYCTIQLDEDFILRSYHFLLPDLLLFQNDFDVVFRMLQGELSCYPPVPPSEMESVLRIEAANKLKPVVGIKVGRPTFHKAWSLKNCFQLTGDSAWAAEIKYDGEYCEIHVDLGESPNDIQIFSKNGKDATDDRQALDRTIRKALRIGLPDCSFEKKCIVLGELVVYSDKEQKILPFSAIRKHTARSGTFLGTMQNSPPHEWEHLMIVFFDVLVVDEKPIMRECLQYRRRILRELIQPIPGRAARSEWTLVDFKTEDGITDLKQTFARSLAQRQEGLVLKPLHTPYFPLLSKVGCHRPGYFIKLKKDYLADMGGERDLGDFSIVGASFDAQVAAKSDIKPLHWTHFYLGCLTNRSAVGRTNAKPKFKVVGSLCMDKCIPKPELKYLNCHGHLRRAGLPKDGDGDAAPFDIEDSFGYGPKMTVAFREPFVVEVLGGGYEKLPNETFEMLRHPRVVKIHQDRGWEDTVTMGDLERMAEQKWELPDADKLDGHARDVALLAKKYVREMDGSQITASETDTTQVTTQRTSSSTSQETLRRAGQGTPKGAVVQETQQTGTQGAWSTTLTAQFSHSTQDKGVRASKEIQILANEDIVEIATSNPAPQLPQRDPILPTPPKSSPEEMPPTGKRRLEDTTLSPPLLKRRRTRIPLRDAGSKENLGAFECDSMEKTIHVFAKEGWKVTVHTS